MEGKHTAGADPGFSNRGSAIDYGHAAHIPTATCEVLYGRVQGPFKGPGSSRALDALLWYLSLIFTHSDAKLDKKTPQSWSKFRGGARLLPPLWIRHCTG